jgi:PhnB protein
MPNGKPGDSHINDIVMHGFDIGSKEIADLVRALHKLDDPDIETLVSELLDVLIPTERSRFPDFQRKQLLRHLRTIRRLAGGPDALGPDLPRLTAHICVKDGNAAISFYEQAFGGARTFLGMTQDGERIMHAGIEMFGKEIVLHDEIPGFCTDVRAPADHAPGLAIGFELRRSDELEALVSRAEAAGATVTLRPTTLLGARRARLRDPFGHVWAFSAPLPSKTEGRLR